MAQFSRPHNIFCQWFVVTVYFASLLRYSTSNYGVPLKSGLGVTKSANLYAICRSLKSAHPAHFPLIVWGLLHSLLYTTSPEEAISDKMGLIRSFRVVQGYRNWYQTISHNATSC